MRLAPKAVKKAKQEEELILADLQKQPGTQTQKVKVLQAELHELSQVVLGRWRRRILQVL